MLLLTANLAIEAELYGRDSHGAVIPRIEPFGFNGLTAYYAFVSRKNVQRVGDAIAPKGIVERLTGTAKCPLNKLLNHLD
jgi:hypothetical protein